MYGVGRLFILVTVTAVLVGIALREDIGVARDALDAVRAFPHWGIDDVVGDVLYCVWVTHTRRRRPVEQQQHDDGDDPAFVVVYHTDAAYARATVNSITSLLRSLDAADDALLVVHVHYIGTAAELGVLARVLERRRQALAPWVRIHCFALSAEDTAGLAAAPEHLGGGSAAAAARARLDVLELYVNPVGIGNDRRELLWMLDADTLVVPPVYDDKRWSLTSWATQALPLEAPLAAAPMPERAPCEFATGATLLRPANLGGHAALAALRRMSERAPLGDHDALNAMYGSRLPDCSSARYVALDWRMNIFALGEPRRSTMDTALVDEQLWHHALSHGEHAHVLQWSGPCKPWMVRHGGRRCPGAELSYSLWNTDAAMRRWFSGYPAPTIVAALAALSASFGVACIYAAYVLLVTVGSRSSALDADSGDGDGDTRPPNEVDS